MRSEKKRDLRGAFEKKIICNYWKIIVIGIFKRTFSLNVNNNNNNDVLALKMVLCKGGRRSWTHNVCGEKI